MPRNKESYKYSTKKMFKGAYLNTASTDANHTGQLNPSDLAYPQVFSNRLELEEMINNIKKAVNAPAYSQVIFNSGATESIATCINWARNINPHGVVLGSEYDHSAVEDACKEYQLEYSQDLRKGKIDDKTVMIFITQVDSKTGEIVNIDNFKRNVEMKYKYLSETPNASGNILQHRPLFCVDATQSIGKIPIDMRHWEADAVFFSLHKIGGPIGVGVMIISQGHYKFHPLIPGKQQHGLRGGTYPLETILDSNIVLNQITNPTHSPIDRKDKWEEVYNRFTKEKLNIHKPRGNHLYNTYLIDLGHCPMGVINTLAERGVYVGNSSACRNEISQEFVETPNEEQHGSIRISFSDPGDLTEEVVDTIIDVIHKDASNPQVKVLDPNKSFEETGKHKK